MKQKQFDLSKYFFILLLLLPPIILCLSAFYSNYMYINPDECHSIADLPFTNNKDVFLVFLQGANFFPLYKFLLKIIHNIFGYNYLFIYKIPSLIAAVCSIFMFYKLSFKFFDNKWIATAAYIIFSLNYEIIHYATQIKPYSFDVLFTTVALYGFIKLHETDLKHSFNNVLKYVFRFLLLLVSVCFISYFSIPFVIVFHSCMAYAILNALIKRDKIKIISYLIFEIGILLFNIFEYNTYVKQIIEDTSLSGMWKDNLFRFAPKSFAAVNSVFNFIFYNFVWFDTDTNILFTKRFLTFILSAYFLGIISTLKEQRKIYAVIPFIACLILSLLGIYPFCNRPIIFLIPSFILIPFCILDLQKSKYLKPVASLAAMLVAYTYLITVAQFGYLNNHITPNNYEQTKWNQTVEKIYKVQGNEVVVSLANMCLLCNNNPKIFTNNLYEMNHEELNNYFLELSTKNDVIYFVYNSVDVEPIYEEYIKSIIESKNFECSYKSTDYEEYNYYKCYKIKTDN